MAQIKEIESCYNYFHPINNKTHKEKKSYIFTEQLREPVEPSRKNNKGGNNNKNVSLLRRYLLAYLPQKCLGKYYSYSKWFCECTNLMDRETLRAPYSYDMEVTDWCGGNGIGKPKVLIQYVRYAHNILKDTFNKTLEAMADCGHCEYEKGYSFIIVDPAGGFDNKKVFSTNDVNDLVKKVETDICNDLNKEWKLGNFRGRQNKVRIYQKPEWQQEYEGRVIDVLNDNLSTLGIPAAYKIESYFEAVKIDRLRHLSGDNNQYGKDLTDNICQRVRKKMNDLHFLDRNGFYYYPYRQSGDDILTVEQLLFPYILNCVDKPEYFESPARTPEELWRKLNSPLWRAKVSNAKLAYVTGMIDPAENVVIEDIEDIADIADNTDMDLLADDYAAAADAESIIDDDLITWQEFCEEQDLKFEEIKNPQAKPKKHEGPSFTHWFGECVG